MRPHRVTFIAAAAAGAISAACAVTVDEDHFFYPGPAFTTAVPEIPPVTVERLSIAVADGATLGGVRLGQANADLEILYFGGNASRADDMVAFLGPLLSGTRANLTMIDYRGYGRSTGTPTIATLKADALAVLDRLRDRAGATPIVVHGVSLGGFVAAYVAANRAIQGLVLEATAPDAQTWAANQVPAVAKPFVRLHIAPALLDENNVEALKRYAGPLLLIAGSKDKITPPRFLQQLFDASLSPHKHVVVANGARHGAALLQPEARKAFDQFLDVVRADAR